MKVLIIAQHIFPILTPRANRATELAKEFSRQNHEVVLYAVLGEYNYGEFEREYGIVVKNIPVRAQVIPYDSDGKDKRHFLDKVLGRVLGKVCEFPNIEFKYSIPKIIAKEEKSDLLLSIADPHQIHWGCAKAKVKYPNNFPTKWIADCGDPFMNNDTSREHFQRFAKDERLFCQLCDYITVPLKGAIEGYYKEYRHKIKVVPQGFKFNMPSIGLEEPDNKITTFAYTGTFIKDIRNPKLFLEYLSEIDKEFQFYVFTKYEDLLVDFKKVLGDRLIIKGLVPRNELLNILKDMNFLVNIENLNCSTQAPSKLIDYAIVGRPILSINPGEIDKQIIDEFFNKNYSNKLIVENLEQYQISNVVKTLLDLL